MKNTSLSIMSSFSRLKENGWLTVFYALLLEMLFVGFLAFIALFTLEMLLPTFVTAHLSLTKFFFILFLCSFVLTFLGRFLDFNFAWKINEKNPLVWIGFLWALGIFMLSLYNFPPLSIPIIILGFLLVGYLFGKIFFSEEE